MVCELYARKDKESCRILLRSSPMRVYCVYWDLHGGTLESVSRESNYQHVAPALKVQRVVLFGGEMMFSVRAIKKPEGGAM